MKAFPQKYPIDAGEPHHEDNNPLDRGMELRDYFAGQVIIGFLANPKTDYSSKLIVRLAYEVADEMMGAREQ
jgi:hypothetical protein